MPRASKSNRLATTHTPEIWFAPTVRSFPLLPAVSFHAHTQLVTAESSTLSVFARSLRFSIAQMAMSSYHTSRIPDVRSAWMIQVFYNGIITVFFVMEMFHPPSHLRRKRPCVKRQPSQRLKKSHIFGKTCQLVEDLFSETSMQFKPKKKNLCICVCVCGWKWTAALTEAMMPYVLCS